MRERRIAVKRVGIVVTIIFALLAFACGFGGTAGALILTQPASNSNSVVNFTVQPGDTTNSVAQRLQDDGLIRNALAFRLYARLKKLDTGIEPGVYKLSPNMQMSAIMSKLQVGQPDEIIVRVREGLRVTQYLNDPPDHLYPMTGLKNFNADNFLTIAKTGKWMDGTPVSGTYWFVPPQQKNAAYALEGYLYPDTYYFSATDDETAVIKRMIGTLGEYLCPGPNGNPQVAGEYYLDYAQCRAHAATVTIGNTQTNIFDAMDKAYFTKNNQAGDVQALYDTLTIASLTQREIKFPTDAAGVANVYHNRYLESIGQSQGFGDTAGFFGADPAVQYGRDTDTPPGANGTWWAPLADAGSKIDPTSLYNTYTHKGLPPGPIAAANWQVVMAAAMPKSPKDFPYFYFIQNKCGKTLYGKTLTDFNTNVKPHINDTNC
jgi:UPF0755 protein